MKLLGALASIGLLLPIATGAATRPCPPDGCPAAATGFFVKDGRLYRPDGVEFRPRGVNKGHWDQGNDGIARSGANTVRLAVDFKQSPAVNQRLVDGIAAANMVPIPGSWGGTCKDDPAILAGIVDTWVAQAPTWTQSRYQKTMLVNIANEWGPSRPGPVMVDGKPVAQVNKVWLDGYTAAIQRLRAAGYAQTLVIDAPGCGQDARTVVHDGAALLAADPQHNLLFDIHVYASFQFPATASWMQDYETTMKQLKASGLPILLGEFGPAPHTDADGKTKSVGPSPTVVPTARLVADAEANGFGWLAWSWDDNNLAGCKTSDVGWFGMTNSCSKYTGDDANELTAFGRLVVPLLKKYNGRGG